MNDRKPDRHDIILNLEPAQALDPVVMPRVKQDGTWLAPRATGVYASFVEGRSNFDIDMLQLRDRLLDLQRTQGDFLIRQEKAQAPARPVLVGPDPGP